MNFLRNQHRPLAIFGLLCVIGCGAAETSLIPVAEVGRAISPTCPDSSSPGYFFAEESLDSRRDDSDMRDGWFSPFLKAAGQQPLWCGARAHTYRLMWLPAMRSAYVVTISEQSGNWTVSTSEFLDPRSHVLSRLDSHIVAPTDPHVVATRSERKLTEPDLRRFGQALRDLDFWGATLYSVNFEVDDGWAMVMEGRQDKAYRVLTRINVNDKAVAAMARTMIEIAGLTVPESIEILSNQVKRPPLPQ